MYAVLEQQKLPEPSHTSSRGQFRFPNGDKTLLVEHVFATLAVVLPPMIVE
jgi:hypothetical protein